MQLPINVPARGSLRILTRSTSAEDLRGSEKDIYESLIADIDTSPRSPQIPTQLVDVYNMRGAKYSISVDAQARAGDLIRRAVLLFGLGTGVLQENDVVLYNCIKDRLMPMPAGTLVLKTKTEWPLIVSSDPSAPPACKFVLGPAPGAPQSIINMLGEVNLE